MKNTWAFLIKRLLDGTIRKFKSHLAVRGDMQEQGTHYGGTYSATVSWTSIRILFILVIKHALKSKQYDFVNAFVQAPLRPGEELYMTLRQGYRDDLKGSHCTTITASHREAIFLGNKREEL